jgi:hypothetical protein
MMVGAEARQLLDDHGLRAVQLVMDRVAAAVRADDELAVLRADRLLREVEAGLANIDPGWPYGEPLFRAIISSGD